MSEPRKIWARRLGAAAPVVLILAVMDLGFARFCAANCDFWIEAYPPADHRVRSEEYHHGLAPSRRVVERWGSTIYRFATNSLGFKDAEPRAIDPGGGGYRVLFLGDSFTEGMGYGFGRTFAGLVAAALEGEGIEVLNAAVGSYSPVIYYLKTKHLLEKTGLRFDEAVVFLDLSDIRDEARAYRFDAGGALVVPPEKTPGLSTRIGHFLRDNSATARLFTIVRDRLGYLRKRIKRRYRTAAATGKPFFDVEDMDMRIGAVIEQKAAAWTHDDKRWADYGEAGRAGAAANMERLRKLLESRGIPLTVVVYPWPDQLFFDRDAPRHQGFWKEWSAARGSGFISLFPAFTEAGPVETLERYFIPYDFHWNAAGHRLVAEAFLERFRPQGR